MSESHAQCIARRVPHSIENSGPVGSQARNEGRLQRHHIQRMPISTLNCCNLLE